MRARVRVKGAILRGCACQRRILSSAARADIQLRHRRRASSFVSSGCGLSLPPYRYIAAEWFLPARRGDWGNRRSVNRVAQRQ